ncbi:MAG TPA: ATP-binding protein [Thermoanaerobaculia bacterium]|jgi:two-component system sensor histidine kinase PilS (NtrC family)|nr:ATP-binding protein [Thermoanaerobaculia bacterium]
MPALERNLRWYIAVRVVAVTSVLLPFFLLVLARPDSFPAEATHYVVLLAGTTFAATLVYIGLLGLLRRHLVVHAYIQFAGDLLLITVMVYYLGGVASPFSLLYLVIIAVASTLLRRRAGVTIATCASVLYAALALSLSAGWLAPLEGMTEVLSGWRVAYNLAIHFLGFYAMALLTSFLAHNATRAERELEVKSEHLADLQVVHRDVIQSITSGLITTDLDGVITSINQSGLAILRQQDQRLLGAPVTESGLLSASQWHDMTAVGEPQGKLRVEVQLPYGEDDSAFIGFSVSRLNDAFGAHRGYILIFQDLTGWRRMQDELRLKDRMAAVGELAAGLAHEIGNPLAAISGSVQMLSSALPDDASQRRLIDILLKESHRLDRTIKGFLRFARPRESASMPFDVTRLLSENMELLANSEEVSVRHHLELDLEPPAARLIADPDQVSQIFWNLARNALRAMPDGGTFRLVGRLDGDAYRLQVIDTGRGMTAAQRANMFHPFQSLFDGGTGIGMAIVYRIVMEHGGRLRVDSAPGGGTTITVELPAAGPGAPLPGRPELAGAAPPPSPPPALAASPAQSVSPVEAAGIAG